MKTFIGLLSALIMVAFVGLLVLRIWDIEILSLPDIVRSTGTLVASGVMAVLLIVIYGSFFKNNSKSYNTNIGRHAHPKSSDKI